MATGHPTTRIFISYRRDDAAAEAGRLRGDLVDVLGVNSVFQDVDLPAGTEYPEALGKQLQAATVLLVVINKTWLFSQDNFGRRRLDLEDDWVRREVRTGLEREILVVPVLIDGTELPPSKALPDDIALVSKRQSLLLRNDNWEHDVIQMVDEIALAAAEPSQSPPSDRSHLTFGLPPLVVADFCDRSQLDDLGGPEVTVVSALHGIGGVGKSQIAARYFEERRHEFNCSAWVDMRDNDGLTDYGTIANTLELDITNGVAEAVISHLRQTPQTWLIVFDNVTSPTQVRPLLPGGGCKVLITSRYRSWRDIAANQVNVDVFDHATAVGFLRDRADRPDDSGAEELAEALGRLPLALALVAALCSEQSVSFDYYRRHKMPAGPMAAMNPNDPVTYDRAIGALWSESLTAVGEIEPQAAILMELLSVLDWTSVDRRWLTKQAPNHLADIDRCLGLLNSYSLIELEDTELAVRHNLLATGIADDADIDRLSANLVDLFKSSLPEVSPNQQTVAQAAEPIRHLQRLLFDRADLITEPLVDTLLQAGDQMNQQGSIISTFHEATCHICTQLLGGDNALALRASQALGWSYWQAGRTDEAITIGEAVLADAERVCGMDHPDTLTSRAILAASYWQAGRTEEAITIEEAVLADSERVRGRYHLDTLTSRANLASSYWQAGRTNEAIAIDEAVLADRERVLGADHPDTLNSRANLATLYRRVGRTEEAITMNEAVLADRERLLGVDHPHTLTSRSNLATSYRQAGRTESPRVW